MTAEEKLVEEVAWRLWREDAERAAPNVARYRTLDAFRNELKLADYRAWMMSARAVIPIVANYVEQRCWEAVIAAMGNETKASQKRVLDAFRTVRTALESIGKERG